MHELEIHVHARQEARLHEAAAERLAHAARRRKPMTRRFVARLVPCHAKAPALLGTG